MIWGEEEGDFRVRRRTTLVEKSFQDVPGLLTTLEPKVIAGRDVEVGLARSIQVVSPWP